jgi:hypothetical protein
MNPTVSDVHVNRPLSNISIAYVQSAERFIAGQVFPVVPVQKRSDRYFTFDRGDFNRDEMLERAPSTESEGGGYSIDSTPTYYARFYSYHRDIDDQIRGNADDPLNLDQEATIYLTTKALIRREVQWAFNYFKAGVWATDKTGAASASGTEVKFWDDSTSIPIVDVRNGKRAVAESTGFEPNTLVLGRAVYDALADHPSFVDRIKYGQTPGAPAIVTLNAMASLFDVDRVLVMNAIKNTASKGQTSAHSFIGGEHAFLCYSAPNPGLMTPSAGYTFGWNGFFAAGPQGNRIRSYRMENLMSDRIEVDMAFDQKVVGADLGYMFVNVLS